MANIYFTRFEANQKLGRKVRSLASLGSVPQDTQGTVIKIVQYHKDQWSVRVRWQIPRQISLIDAAEFSFFRREKARESDVSKSVYEESLQEIN